jgi:type VI secretion system protein ImpG
MKSDLYRFYERELFFVRRLAEEFGKQYPAAAGRLFLKEGRSEDPHVERLIQAFAFLTGRVQLKLNDEFPELTEALFNILYPHYLAPIPSLATVQFTVDADRAPPPSGLAIARHSLVRSPPVNDVYCDFRTCYPVTLWPIAITMARLQVPPFPPGLQPPNKTAAVLRIQLETLRDLRFEQLELSTLRLFLHGDNQIVPPLYEFIFNNTLQVVIRSLDREEFPRPPVVFAPHEILSPVGFEIDDGLLSYPPQSFLGYRLLTEFFAYPAKFHYVDLGGWRKVAAAGFGQKIEIDLFLNRTLESLEKSLDHTTFQLGTTPIINLFEHTGDALDVTQTKQEYPLEPNVNQPLGYEVISVQEVEGLRPPEPPQLYKPFYSFRHGEGEANQVFWYAARQQSKHASDHGTDIVMRFVDLALDPKRPYENKVLVRTLCSNRDLPVKLQKKGEDLFFNLLTAVPMGPVRCLRPPTHSLRPPLRHGHYWRLLSHLSSNHLSVSDGTYGRDALQEMLRLYDFSEAETSQNLMNVTRQIIEGISEVHHRRVTGRIGSNFCRGMETTIELEEQKYVGTGAYLFASVLERFLGWYVSINSFSQLVMRLKGQEGYLKKWPPRAGDLSLL